MPATKGQHSMQTPPAPDEATPSWRRAREFLETCKARIAGQINAYPPPIPACDTQFNTLLEQRGKLTEELNRLEVAHRESRGGSDTNHALADFIVTSEFIEEAAGRKIKEG